MPQRSVVSRAVLSLLPILLLGRFVVGQQARAAEERAAAAHKAIYRTLAGGVTTSLLLHGSANMIGGQALVIRTVPRWMTTSLNIDFP